MNFKQLLFGEIPDSWNDMNIDEMEWYNNLAKALTEYMEEIYISANYDDYNIIDNENYECTESFKKFIDTLIKEFSCIDSHVVHHTRID